MKNFSKNLFGWFWKIGFVAFLISFGVYQSHKIGQIHRNEEIVTAEIIGIVDCFKNGRCVNYQYSYEGVVYQQKASSNWTFSNWCAERNDCKGYKFDLFIDKTNPENSTANWKDIFDNKNFTKE